MAGNVARLPSNSHGGDGPTPSDIYRIAVEEYRFQAQYNWSRTQYLLAFNAGVLAVAIGLTGQPVLLGVLAFAFGIVASVLAILAVRVQHDYYRTARNHVQRIEVELGVDPTQRLDTTPRSVAGSAPSQSTNSSTCCWAHWQSPTSTASCPG